MTAIARTGLIALLVALCLATPAAAETVYFRSTTWPPTPLQQRLAKTAGQTIAEQASVKIAGELYLPPGKGPFPAGCTARRSRLRTCGGAGNGGTEVPTNPPNPCQ